MHLHLDCLGDLRGTKETEKYNMYRTIPLIYKIDISLKKLIYAIKKY